MRSVKPNLRTKTLDLAGTGPRRSRSLYGVALDTCIRARRRLGEHLELGDREVELIRTAGSLHDLGKIGYVMTFSTTRALSEEEWEIMRRHPDIGADMIVQHSALAEVAPIVRHHHERWDGSGYPQD